MKQQLILNLNKTDKQQSIAVYAAIAYVMFNILKDEENVVNKQHKKENILNLINELTLVDISVIESYLADFAMFKARHTAGLNMNHAARKLSKAIDTYQNEADLWAKWRNTKVTDNEAFKTFAEVANCKFITKTKAMAYDVPQLLLEPEVYRNKTLIRLWEHYVTDEKKTLGSNAWAMYNTMTHWATHAEATKSTAQKNIAAIQVARQDKIRQAAKNSILLAA